MSLRSKEIIPAIPFSTPAVVPELDTSNQKRGFRPELDLNADQIALETVDINALAAEKGANTSSRVGGFVCLTHPVLAMEVFQRVQNEGVSGKFNAPLGATGRLFNLRVNSSRGGTGGGEKTEDNIAMLDSYWMRARYGMELDVQAAERAGTYSRYTPHIRRYEEHVDGSVVPVPIRGNLIAICEETPERDWALKSVLNGARSLDETALVWRGKIDQQSGAVEYSPAIFMDFLAHHSIDALRNKARRKSSYAKDENLDLSIDDGLLTKFIKMSDSHRERALRTSESYIAAVVKKLYDPSYKYMEDKSLSRDTKEMIKEALLVTRGSLDVSSPPQGFMRCAKILSQLQLIKKAEALTPAGEKAINLERIQAIQGLILANEFIKHIAQARAYDIRSDGMRASLKAKGKNINDNTAPGIRYHALTFDEDDVSIAMDVQSRLERMEIREDNIQPVKVLKDLIAHLAPANDGIRFALIATQGNRLETYANLSPSTQPGNSMESLGYDGKGQIPNSAYAHYAYEIPRSLRRPYLKPYLGSGRYGNTGTAFGGLIALWGTKTPEGEHEPRAPKIPRHLAIDLQNAPWGWAKEIIDRLHQDGSKLSDIRDLFGGNFRLIEELEKPHPQSWNFANHTGGEIVMFPDTYRNGDAFAIAQNESGTMYFDKGTIKHQRRDQVRSLNQPRKNTRNRPEDPDYRKHTKANNNDGIISANEALFETRLVDGAVYASGAISTDTTALEVITSRHFIHAVPAHVAKRENRR